MIRNPPKYAEDLVSLIYSIIMSILIIVFILSTIM